MTPAAYLAQLQIAAGCFGSDGYGRGVGYDPALGRLDGIVLKTTSQQPIQPSRRPRFVRLPDGNYWNWVGLRNPGLPAIEPLLARRRLAGYGNLWLSLYAAKPDDWPDLLAQADRISGLAGYELNLSCPNLTGGQPPDWPDLARLTAVRPIRLKLSASQARAVLAGRLDLPDGASVVVGNSRPERGGGISGPILAADHQQLIAGLSAARPDLELIGCGGVASAADIDAYRRAGASRVQVGAHFRATGRLDFLGPVGA